MRAAACLPGRIWGEVRKWMSPGEGIRFRFRALRANYEIFWTSDSDARNSMDPHEMIFWFLSRGWSVPSHPTFGRRFSVRHGEIIVRKTS